MTKILVVDDHELVRMGLVRMLSDVQNFEVIGDACSGEQALIIARELSPDVVLMDVKMPGMGGIEATRQLLAHDPHIRIVAVTACEDTVFPERLLQAGAKGYVSKTADLSEMVDAIESASRGDVYLSGKMAHELAIKRFANDDNVNPFELLSDREMETALLITNGKKAADVAEILCVSPKTVNSYRYRIFEKLNINSDVELTIMAVKNNMIDLEAM